MPSLPWPTERETAARNLAAQGLSPNEMSARIEGVTRQAIASYLRRRGVDYRSGQWPEERKARCIEFAGKGYSATQIARELNCGISRSAVLGFLYRQDVSLQSTYGWSGPDVAACKKLWIGGYIPSQIATALGWRYSESAVRAQIERIKRRQASKRVRQRAYYASHAGEINRRRAKPSLPPIAEETVPVVPVYRLPRRAAVLGVTFPGRAFQAMPVTLVELQPHHCRYIISESNCVGQPVYCGQDVLRRSFCEHHYRECFQTV